LPPEVTLDQSPDNVYIPLSNPQDVDTFLGIHSVTGSLLEIRECITNL
jgi:hypothetical protein